MVILPEKDVDAVAQILIQVDATFVDIVRKNRNENKAQESTNKKKENEKKRTKGRRRLGAFTNVSGSGASVEA